MAYVLSLPSQSPLKRSFSGTLFMTSESLVEDDTSTGTVRRSKSGNGYEGSVFSGVTHSLHEKTENTPPLSSSQSFLSLADGIQLCSLTSRSSYHSSRKVSWGTGEFTDPHPDPHAIAPSETELHPSKRLSIVSSFGVECADIGIDISNAAESSDQGISEEECTDKTKLLASKQNHDNLKSGSGIPFRRWMSTLRRKNLQRRRALKPRVERWPLEDSEPAHPELTVPQESLSHSKHKASRSASSSMAFVTAVKSASITLASASIAPLSGKAGRNSFLKSEGRGSGISDPRMSMDSNAASLAHFVDEGSWLRSIQRRKVLQELIETEEGYLADLKALANVYSTLLASVPTLSSQTRACVNNLVTRIIKLHEDLFAELHLAIPNAEFPLPGINMNLPLPKSRHHRWHSADIVPGRASRSRFDTKFRHSLDGFIRRPKYASDMPTADTKTVAAVSKLFNKFMNRFFIYEEYAAQYEKICEDMTSVHKNVSKFPTYEKGTEVLSTSLTSINQRGPNHRRALTFSDLLIKPIQRICKYPLLFAEICKVTPVYDDPESYAEAAKALSRLKTVATETNKAIHDPRKRMLIEKTWLLQDRLKFDSELSPAVIFRLLGRVYLCGVLHVAYNKSEGVRGSYMICILYKSCLLLAVLDRQCLSYNVVAAIYLANSAIEEPDNGRGLQCHTAPYSWKLFFESGHRLFEILMTACSTNEEKAWKENLRSHITSESQELSEYGSVLRDLLPPLALDAKSLGTVFGQPDTFTRRMSVHRAATMGPRTNMNQVIIKNTKAEKDPTEVQAGASFPVTRSQSFLSPTHIPILAPRRAERVRLETVLSEVWTKETLPYPGMTLRRIENPIRASANSVMRKLSMASIASSFSKRSASYTSLSHPRADEARIITHKTSAPSLRRPPMTSSKRRGTAMVDFHSAPNAFLPADFEVPSYTPARRRPISRTMVDDSTSAVSRPASLAGKRLSRPPSFRGGGHRKVSNLSIRTSTIQGEEKPKNMQQGHETQSTPTLPTTPMKQAARSKIRLFRFWA